MHTRHLTTPGRWLGPRTSGQRAAVWPRERLSNHPTTFFTRTLLTLNHRCTPGESLMSSLILLPAPPSASAFVSLLYHRLTSALTGFPPSYCRCRSSVEIAVIFSSSEIWTEIVLGYYEHSTRPLMDACQCCVWEKPFPVYECFHCVRLFAEVSQTLPSRLHSSRQGRPCDNSLLQEQSVIENINKGWHHPTSQQHFNLYSWFTSVTLRKYLCVWGVCVGWEWGGLDESTFLFASRDSIDMSRSRLFWCDLFNVTNVLNVVSAAIFCHLRVVLSLWCLRVRLSRKFGLMLQKEVSCDWQLNQDKWAAPRYSLCHL